MLLHICTIATAAPATKDNVGGIFGSDDDDDNDLFSTPSKTTPPKPADKEMSQAEKDALSAAVFGSSSGFDFGQGEDNLFTSPSAPTV